MKLYIAGPMSGLPDFNYPAFFKAADLLGAASYDTINPARTEGREGCSSWLDFMRLSLIDIAACDGIATLDGHQNSRGARIETRLAWDLDLPCRSVDEWLALAEDSAA